MFNERAAFNVQTGWLGVLADIHANLEALKAVLNDLEALGIDRFITLEDVVGYGPNPGECLELVRERAIFNLAGNHDRAVAVGEGVDEMSRWARQTFIGPEAGLRWKTWNIWEIFRWSTRPAVCGSGCLHEPGTSKQ